jgi:hypothetical protein
VHGQLPLQLASLLGDGLACDDLASGDLFCELTDINCSTKKGEKPHKTN